MRARRLAGMVLVAVAACAPEAAPPEDAPGPVDTPAANRQEPVAVQEIACEDLARTILAVEPDRRSLEARFGAPDSVLATTEPNRHVPDRVDSLFVVHYRGLTASLRKPEGGGDMVDGVVVTESRSWPIRPSASARPRSGSSPRWASPPGAPPIPWCTTAGCTSRSR